MLSIGGFSRWMSDAADFSIHAADCNRLRQDECSYLYTHTCPNANNSLLSYARTRSLINICWYVAVAVRPFRAKSVRVSPFPEQMQKVRVLRDPFYVRRPLLTPPTATSATAQLCLNQLSPVIPLQNSSWLRE